MKNLENNIKIVTCIMIDLGKVDHKKTIKRLENICLSERILLISLSQKYLVN